MRIGIFAGSCLPIDAQSLENRPLGGTETGVIRVAEILVRRGHEVIVFTRMANPAPSFPQYVPAQKVQQCGAFDAWISVQWWESLFYGVPARKYYYWTGDGWDQYANFGIGDLRVSEKVAGFLAVSSWQAQSLAEASYFPREKCFVIGNGVHLPYFEGEEQRVRKRLIYTSAPYRGLQFVPKIYLELKKLHPELELHVFSGMNIYDADQPYRGPEAAQYQQLVPVLQKLPGCCIHGNVRQRELAREYMKSSVYIYPNVIFETCCITAMEAQAAGCPIVAGRNSALPETVGPAGMLIDGAPGSAQYVEDFAGAVHKLLADDELWQNLSRTGKERAQREFSWDRVVDRLEEVMQK